MMQRLRELDMKGLVFEAHLLANILVPLRLLPDLRHLSTTNWEHLQGLRLRVD